MPAASGAMGFAIRIGLIFIRFYVTFGVEVLLLLMRFYAAFGVETLLQEGGAGPAHSSCVRLRILPWSWRNCLRREHDLKALDLRKDTRHMPVVEVINHLLGHVQHSIRLRAS